MINCSGCATSRTTRSFGEYAGREGDIVAGVIQQGTNPRMVLVDLGKVEAILPLGRAGAGRGVLARCADPRATCGGVSQGAARPVGHAVSRTHPDLVRKLFALEVPEIASGAVEIVGVAREAGHRTKIAVQPHQPGVNAKGACIGRVGQRVRNVIAELHGEKIDIVDCSDDPATFVANALSPAEVDPRRGRRPRREAGAGHRARLPALAGHRQGRAERPAGRPAHRLAHRHPFRRGGRRLGARPAGLDDRGGQGGGGIRGDALAAKQGRVRTPHLGWYPAHGDAVD